MTEDKKDRQGGGASDSADKGDKPRRRGFRPRRRRKKKIPDENANAQGASGSTSKTDADSLGDTPKRRDRSEKGDEKVGRNNRRRRDRGNTDRTRDRTRDQSGDPRRQRRDDRGRADKSDARQGVIGKEKIMDNSGWEPVVEEEYTTPNPKGDFQNMSAADIEFLKPHEANVDMLLEDMPETDFNQKGELRDVAGVKLHMSGNVADYDCQDMILARGETVIVETGRGLAIGEVLVPTARCFSENDDMLRVIRRATHNDMRQRDRNLNNEQQAFQLCRESIERFHLNMKLIKVDYLHGGNKAVFFFSADGRVDFRELVRDLARRLHIRVEMRQIGVRDASRMLGGLGACGLRLCCNRYIREFAPVSIRMAKDQDLVLNPEKVSGLCGRLMCCLAYENDTYRNASKQMPRLGRRVNTPKGEGRIRDRDVLRKLVKIQVADEPGLHEFPISEVQLLDVNDSSSSNRQDRSEDRKNN